MTLPIIQTGTITSNTAVPGSTLTLTKPTGVAAGDLLLLFVGSDIPNLAAPQFADFTDAASDDWTLVQTDGDATADCHYAVYYRVADGGEGVTTIVPATTSADMWGYYVRVTGAHPVNPIHQVGTTYSVGSASSHDITGVTTTVNDCVVFYILSFDGGDGDPFGVTGTGFAEIGEIEAGSGVGNGGGCFGSRDLATAGASGTATVSSNVADGAVGFQFAITPAPDGAYITSVTPGTFADADTGIVAAGGNFGASQGTGVVELGDSATYGSANLQEQTVTSWSNTSITFTGVLGSLTPGNLYLYVTNNSAEVSEPYAVAVSRAMPFQMAASSFIDAGGEAVSSGILTAPSGKTTGDFDAGRAWDDENGSDSIDITADNYTELVWNIEPTANIDAAAYQFRVFVAGVELDTITVTPQWTYAAGGATITPTPAALSLSTVNPTAVKGSLSITPTPASVALSTVDPTIVKGAIAITSTPATATISSVDPTVVTGPVTITPTPATNTLSSVDPVVDKGALSITPTAITNTLSSVDPTVVRGAISITPTANTVTLSRVDPTVVTGGITRTPTAASAVLSVVAPIVVRGALTITPTAVIATLTAVDPTVIAGIVIEPTPVSLTLASVNPVVVLGAITITPATSDVVVSTVDPTTVKGAYSVTPTASQVNLDSVDPTVIAGQVIETTPVSLALTSVNPTVVRGAVTITPATVDVALSTVDPSVIAGELITPAPVSLALSSVNPTVVMGAINIVPVSADLVITVVAPSVEKGAYTATPQPSGCTLSSVDPTVVYGGYTIIPPVSTLGVASVDPVVERGPLTIAPTASQTGLSVVAPVIVKGAAVIAPTAVTTALATGGPLVVFGLLDVPDRYLYLVRPENNLFLVLSENNVFVVSSNPTQFRFMF